MHIIPGYAHSADASPRRAERSPVLFSSLSYGWSRVSLSGDVLLIHVHSVSHPIPQLFSSLLHYIIVNGTHSIACVSVHIRALALEHWPTHSSSNQSAALAIQSSVISPSINALLCSQKKHSRTSNERENLF